MNSILKDVISSVPPMVMGSKGWYFKFGTAMDTNGDKISLYFKPNFVKAPYVLGNHTVTANWLEINVIVLGEELPDLCDGWMPLRGGEYKHPDGTMVKGILIGKLLTPMGEFNDNVQGLYEHASKLADKIDAYLVSNLLSKIDGKMDYKVSVGLNHLFGMLKDTWEVADPVPLLNKDFVDYQEKISKTLINKTKSNPPSSLH